MPHANIWIRKEDWPKWEAIPDKSRWVAAALQGTDVPKFVKADKERAKIEKIIEPIIKKVTPIIPQPTPVKQDKEPTELQRRWGINA